MTRSCAERVALTSNASSLSAFDRDKGRISGQRRARHTIRHPHRNRGRVLIVFGQPELAPVADAVPHENRLAVQRGFMAVFIDRFGAGGGNRTLTGSEPHGILRC